MLENPILRSLCYAVGVEKGIPSQPPSQLLMQAEIDAAIATDSGYSPENFGVIDSLPMIPELFDILNKQKMSATLKEIEESGLQRQKTIMEEKEEQEAQSRSAAIDSLQDAQAEQQKWLKDTHEFGGLRLTGKEWAHVAEYAKENHARIKAEWMEDGMTAEQADKGLKALEIMGRGPQNDAERQILREVQQSGEYDSHFRKEVENSGLDLSTLEKNNAVAVNKTAHMPSFEPVL